MWDEQDAPQRQKREQQVVEDKLNTLSSKTDHHFDRNIQVASKRVD
jgi:hypothetical protein